MMALVAAFRCSRTGLYYPSDYVEEWGRKYGHGLGPVPVSEALINNYDSPVCDGRSTDQTMHSLSTSKAQIDFVMVEEAEYKSKMAILAIDDDGMSKRAPLMRDKQLQKSSRLAAMFPKEVEVAAMRLKNRESVAVN